MLICLQVSNDYCICRLGLSAKLLNRGDVRMKNFSSPDFIAKLKQRDSEAVTVLVKAYSGHLFKAGLGMGLSEEKSNDATMATWSTFFEIVSKFESRSHIRTFLFGIFYNKVSELRRSDKKFAQTDPIEEVMESSFSDDGHWKPESGDPLDLMEGKEMLEIIEKCIGCLPEMQKDVFILKEVQDADYQEICNIMDLSYTNLRQLLYRAKSRLRSCVQKSLEA